MTPEEKLLFYDVCARAPHGLKVKIIDHEDVQTILTINTNKPRVCFSTENWHAVYIFDILPYLRPMSSLTDEEIGELSEITHSNIAFNREDMENSMCLLDGASIKNNALAIDWFNANHIDYHGLIPKGLALVALEGMYKNTEQ